MWARFAMLDWTGERFVPWAKEAAVAYEHLHRYIWASNFVDGKRVLDLASGEGYGAEILARRASFVSGVDIDDEAFRHASERYRQPNLEFIKGCLTEVPIAGSHLFDVITCFEALEHIQQHDEMMREVTRLLKPDGLFIVSIPNKDTYSVDGGPNPFHVRELAFDEFNALLTRYFPAVSFLGQRVCTSSSMWPLNGAHGEPVQKFEVERRNGEFQTVDTGNRIPVYFLAMASPTCIKDCQGSILVDHSDVFIHDKDQALAWRAEQVEDLLKFTDYLQGELKTSHHQIQLLNDELEGMQKSRGWKLVLKVRAFRNRLIGNRYHPR
jgi:SAM-dependent methyltransferase